MGSNDDYEEPLQDTSSKLMFQDPFASLEGGVGNLSITAEPNRAHASSNATSTASAQCSNFERDDESKASSSRSSTSPVSRDISPSRSLPSKGQQEDYTNLVMPLPSRGNAEYVLRSVELDAFNMNRSDTPTSCGSPKSSDPDVTPRPYSRTGGSERNASFDGGVDPIKGHGARLLSPMPFTVSPVSTRSTSVAASMQSFKSVESTNDEWDIETLREMTDVVREALQLGSIPEAHLEILSEILKAFLIDEQACSTAVSLEVVALTYFDKTLDAILMQITKTIAVAEPSVQEIFSRTTSLQHKWQQRFKEKYFSIDEIRIKEIKDGALRDMKLDTEDWRNDETWIVENNEHISHQQGDLGFKVGDWWLNIACAFRDGIVGEVDEKATKGPYNVTALPLLSGEEVEGPTLNMYEYVKRGTGQEMPFSVLGNRGGPIRILRGHALKSKFAPKIGVRYDGLFVVKQYGHKLADLNNNIYECRLILERLTGQVSINDVLLSPTPSQMDDWALYIRIVGDHIRARQGDAEYSEWRDFLEAQDMAKHEFIQRKELEVSFPRYRLVERKRISAQD